MAKYGWVAPKGPSWVTMLGDLRELLSWSAFQGGLALFLLLVLTGWANITLMYEGGIRVTAFAGLVATVVVLVLTNRSFVAIRVQGRIRNLPLTIILGLATAIFALVFFSTSIAGLFSNVRARTQRGLRHRDARRHAVRAAHPLKAAFP